MDQLKHFFLLNEREKRTVEYFAFGCWCNLEFIGFPIKVILAGYGPEVHILIHVCLLHQGDRWTCTIEQLRLYVNIEVFKIMTRVYQICKCSVYRVLRTHSLEYFGLSEALLKRL